MTWISPCSLTFPTDQNRACNYDNHAAVRRQLKQPDSYSSKERPSALATQLTDLDGSVSLAFEEPMGLEASRPLIEEGEFNTLLTANAAQGGRVTKTGVLEEDKWCGHPHACEAIKLVLLRDIAHLVVV